MAVCVCMRVYVCVYVCVCVCMCVYQLTLGIWRRGTPSGWRRVWRAAPLGAPSPRSSAGSCGGCRNSGTHQGCPESTPVHAQTQTNTLQGCISNVGWRHFCWYFKPDRKTNRASSPLPSVFRASIKSYHERTENPTTPAPCRWLVGEYYLFRFGGVGSTTCFCVWSRSVGCLQRRVFWQPAYGAGS